MTEKMVKVTVQQTGRVLELPATYRLGVMPAMRKNRLQIAADAFCQLLMDGEPDRIIEFDIDEPVFALAKTKDLEYRTVRVVYDEDTLQTELMMEILAG